MLTKVKLDKETREIIKRINNEDIHILDYLNQKDRKPEIVTILTKHLLTSILQDLSNFIYESLSCAKKGKMSVAYTLLRKPLTDELFILEQLLIDREEFIDRFYFKGIPRLYDPSAGNFAPERINEIINQATQELGPIKSFFNELVFDFRYNKASASGLNGMMNHAHHIVTADKHYRTNDKNLNFVFSTESDYQKYWTHYYYFVPYLIIYCSCIADCLAGSLVKVNQDFQTRRELKRFLALIFWDKEVHKKSDTTFTQFFRVLSKELKITCKCGHKNRLIEADFRLFFETEVFLCTNCLTNLLGSTDLGKRMTALLKK